MDSSLSSASVPAEPTRPVAIGLKSGACIEVQTVRAERDRLRAAVDESLKNAPAVMAPWLRFTACGQAFRIDWSTISYTTIPEDE